MCDNELLAHELADLRKAVAEMRQHQKEYFRTRNSSSLGLAKKTEKLVDELLLDSRQPNLWLF